VLGDAVQHAAELTCVVLEEALSLLALELPDSIRELGGHCGGNRRPRVHTVVLARELVKLVLHFGGVFQSR
jgi:hypothetical protein